MKPIKSFKVVACSNLTSKDQQRTNCNVFFDDGSTFLQDFRVKQKMIFSPNVILVIWELPEKSLDKIILEVCNQSRSLIQRRNSEMYVAAKLRARRFEKIFFKLSSIEIGGRSGIYSYHFVNHFKRFENIGVLKTEIDSFIEMADVILDEDSIFVFDICENLDDVSNEDFFSKYKYRHQNFDCRTFLEKQAQVQYDKWDSYNTG